MENQNGPEASENLRDWDDDGYPTETLLERVKKWPHTDGFAALLETVGANWSYPDRWVKDGKQYRCSTGGWSGNEDLIGALRRNSLFWACCWVSSNRGGGYEFEAEEVGVGERINALSEKYGL